MTLSIETWIGSSTIKDRLILVLQVVLNVPHLVLFKKEIQLIKMKEKDVLVDLFT